MGIFDGAVIACDIDGTLQVGGYLPQRNIDAMEYFKSEGGSICLATGRTAPALSPVIANYNGYCPSVVGNGSMIFDTVSGEVLFEKCLEESELECIETVMKTVPDVGIEVHSGKTVFKLTETEETRIHQDFELIKAKPITFDELKNIKIHKILYLFDNRNKREAAKKALEGFGKKSAFYDTNVMIFGKVRIYLEHIPGGVSKSDTLLRLVDILGKDKSRLYAIGDGLNDMEMLKTATLSACPSGAAEEVKKISDIIVGDAENGAVADFIDILKRRLSNGCKD